MRIVLFLGSVVIQVGRSNQLAIILDEAADFDTIGVRDWMRSPPEQVRKRLQDRGRIQITNIRAINDFRNRNLRHRLIPIMADQEQRIVLRIIPRRGPSKGEFGTSVLPCRDSKCSNVT